MAMCCFFQMIMANEIGSGRESQWLKGKGGFMVRSSMHLMYLFVFVCSGCMKTESAFSAITVLHFRLLPMHPRKLHPNYF